MWVVSAIRSTECPLFILTVVTASIHDAAVQRRYYKNGDYEEAVDYYAMALQYCPEDGEYEKERAVYLGNRAACHLQLSEVTLSLEP